MLWKRQISILTLVFFLSALCAPILHADSGQATWQPLKLSNGSYGLGLKTPGGVWLPQTRPVPGLNGIPATMSQAQAAATKINAGSMKLIVPPQSSTAKVTPTKVTVAATTGSASIPPGAKWVAVKGRGFGNYNLRLRGANGQLLSGSSGLGSMSQHAANNVAKAMNSQTAATTSGTGSTAAKTTNVKAPATTTVAPPPAGSQWVAIKGKGIGNYHLRLRGANGQLLSGSSGLGSMSQHAANNVAKAMNSQGTGTTGGTNTGTTAASSSRIRNMGTQLKGAAKNGLAMAAVATVVTVGADMVDQAKRNDGLIDVNQSIGILGTRQFLGGTAGAITGATLASTAAQFVPGPLGAVVRPLAAFTGAAIGAEAGAGTWKDADWVKIGAQTVGSTAGWLAGAKIGAIIGTALIPIPGVGTAIGIVGGLVGSWAAGKVIDWLRKKKSDDPYTDEEELADAERMTGTNVQYGEWDWNSNPSGKDTLFGQTAEW